MFVQLADQLLALRSGAMTLADFASATSSDAMAAALARTALPGRMVSPGQPQPAWHLAINVCTLPLHSLVHACTLELTIVQYIGSQRWLSSTARHAHAPRADAGL